MQKNKTLHRYRSRDIHCVKEKAKRADQRKNHSALIFFLLLWIRSILFNFFKF